MLCKMFSQCRCLLPSKYLKTIGAYSHNSLIELPLVDLLRSGTGC